jgi:hypothetical protein
LELVIIKPLFKPFFAENKKQMKKVKQKKTIKPILDNSSAGKFKRLPKKGIEGDYFINSISKYHN